VDKQTTVATNTQGWNYDKKNNEEAVAVRYILMISHLFIMYSSSPPYKQSEGWKRFDLSSTTSTESTVKRLQTTTQCECTAEQQRRTDCHGNPREEKSYLNN
jgi:hypothetical protein